MKDFITWDDSVIDTAATCARNDLTQWSWSIPHLEQPIDTGIEMLSAVLQHAKRPRSSMLVFECFLLVALPSLVLSRLGLKQKKQWRFLVAPAELKYRSLEDMGLDWYSMIRAAKSQNVIVENACGEWSAGKSASEPIFTALEARTMVAWSCVAEFGAQAEKRPGGLPCES
jgi:hypothetical protein